MHELGIVFKIIDDLKEVARVNNVMQIRRVTIELGEVSAVIPGYLTDCWEWAREKHELLKGCEMVFETLHAVTFCEDCRREYRTVEYGKTCPHCGGCNTYLVCGNEFVIKEIEVPARAHLASGGEYAAAGEDPLYESASSSAEEEN